MKETKFDKSALYNIGYGLYVVTCNDGLKDNGLIVNTVLQVTSSPARISVTINKQNSTGICNSKHHPAVTANNAIDSKIQTTSEVPENIKNEIFVARVVARQEGKKPQKAYINNGTIGFDTDERVQ